MPRTTFVEAAVLCAGCCECFVCKRPLSMHHGTVSCAGAARCVCRGCVDKHK